MKRVIALMLVLVLSLGLFAGCGGGDEKVIRYLNFKPEIADKYEKIAKAYEEETGIKLEVESAASGTYEQTLKARMATNEAPVLFQINGPIGLKAWEGFTADLSNTQFYSHYTNKDEVVKKDGKVYGIPYALEGYGIIYNDAIMREYFAMEDRAVKNIKSATEIKNFETLKAVVEDMQSKKDELGIEGVFAATSLKKGEEWRWQTHLANLPIHYEIKNNNIDMNSDEIQNITFEYGKNFQNIFDLYLNNSTTPKTQLGTVDVNMSMGEVALGKAVMVQNGNWGANQISDEEGNIVKEEDIKFMPIYTGVEGEETQGLAIGTENFMCINSQASEEEQKMADDFLTWLYTSEKGKSFVLNDLGFIAGFDSFGADEMPKDVLAKQVVEWNNNPDVDTVTWDFTIFPSQAFKDKFGVYLAEYAKGNMTWEEVEAKVVADWASEYELIG